MLTRSENPQEFAYFEGFYFFLLENNNFSMIKCLLGRNTFRLAVENVADLHSYSFWPLIFI